tara:strand:- start:460 stop:789 length:330 start_codon:yes stop_codon:yes gene_type:complete
MNRFRHVPTSFSPDELDAASLIADLVIQNAHNFVEKRCLHEQGDFNSPYMQTLLTQHIKVQTAYLSCAKWTEGLKVSVTQDGDLDVNAKVEFDNTTGGCLNVRAFQGEE